VAKGVTGFEGAGLRLADSVKFLEGQGASAAVGGEISIERGDALEEVCSGTKIEDLRFLLLPTRRPLGKGAPGSGLVSVHKKAAGPAGASSSSSRSRGVAGFRFRQGFGQVYCS
jgi:hypothetical protein